MKQSDFLHRIGILAIALVAAQGCGGNSSAVSTPVVKTGGPPTPATLTHVGDLLTSFSQAAICGSFTGYGPRLLTHRQLVFDTTLGLWYAVSISSTGTFEKLYVDQAKTQPAGSMTYLVNDAALTEGGSFSLTAGAYAGLSGFYLQSLQSVGSLGSISFSIPNIAVTDGQFEIQQDSTGGNPGKSTIGVALQDGFVMTEIVTMASDGSQVTSTTDSGSFTTTFSLSSAFVGNGTITGKAPGLPAKVIWTTVGNGTITFADASTMSISSWKLAPGPRKD